MSILSARFRYGLPLVVSTGLTCVIACSSSDDDAPGGPSAGTTGSAGKLGTGGTSAGAPATAGSGGTSAGAPTVAGRGGTGGSGPGAGGASAGSAGKASAGSGGAAAGSGGKSSGGAAATAGAGGTTGGSSAGAPTGGTGGASGGGEFKLTSPNHMDGAEFAPKYTCSEKGFQGSLMPALNWTAVTGAKSYAITFLDRSVIDDGVGGNKDLGYHWAVYNIPPTVTSLPEGMKMAQLPEGAKQIGDYLGPCPNFQAGTRVDEYEFAIFALPVASITVQGTSTAGVKNADAAIAAANPIDSATLGGKSDASPP